MRHWLLVAVLAWALASLVGQAIDRADAARQQWGRTTSTWVVDRPLRAGDAFDGAVRTQRWPAALAPPDAVDRLPPGARAAGPIDEGTVLTAAMVEPATATRRTVALPLPDAHLPVEPGDRVDVWATADAATVADGSSATTRVASGARVAEANGSSVVLEVAPAQVAAVAEAGATATITLVGAR